MAAPGDPNKFVDELSNKMLTQIKNDNRAKAGDVKRLSELGVTISIDDFGTGYASLTHLVNVPVDIIKIDRAFVARLWPDDPSTIIVEGLIEIARRLGFGELFDDAVRLTSA